MAEQGDTDVGRLEAGPSGAFLSHFRFHLPPYPICSRLVIFNHQCTMVQALLVFAPSNTSKLGQYPHAQNKMRLQGNF